MELVDVFAGTWRVVSGSASEIVFFDDETATFRLAGFAGSMQCRYGATEAGAPAVRFAWAGHDGDGRSVRGTGWAVLERDALAGTIRAVARPESSFLAVRCA